MRPYGGLIGKYRSASSLAANGMWVQNEHAMFKQNGAWPLNLDSDPYFNYTTLLLPGTGTNGANNNMFLDSSTNNFTITRNGNTTQGTFSPFSQTGWSNYFTGSSTNALTVATGSGVAFGTGDFCQEFFLYASSYPATWRIISYSVVCASMLQQSGAVLNIDTGVGTLNTGITLPTNTWFHLAYTRQSGRVRVFVDGVLRYNVADTTSYSNASVDIGGAAGFSQSWDGYISNARIIKGSVPAAYQTSSTTNGTSIFTSPTSPLTAVTGTELLACQSNRFVDSNTQTTAKTITVTGSPRVTAFSPFAPTQPYSASAVGGSGYFDGTGDYLQTISTSTIGTSQYSIEFWVYFTASGDEAYIFGQIATGTPVFLYQGGTLSFARAFNSTILSYSVSLTPFSWYHIAAVRNSSNTVSMYLNGSRVATGTDSTNYTTASTYIAGGRSGGVANEWLTGYLSDARFVIGNAVYDPTLTTLTIPTAPLTAVTGTSLLLNFTNAGIYDATGKNVIETAGDAQVSTAQSKFGGGSKAFDGTGDYLVAPSSLFWTLGSTEDFTIEFWFYTSVTVPISGSTPSTLITNYPDWNTWTNRWAIATNDNKIKWYDHTGSAAIASNNFTYSVWNHVAVVRSSSSIKMYINGTQEGSTQTTNQTYTSTEKLYVGLVPSGSAFNGYIQDIRITKYARYITNFSPPIRLSSIK